MSNVSRRLPVFAAAFIGALGLLAVLLLLVQSPRSGNPTASLAAPVSRSAASAFPSVSPTPSPANAASQIVATVNEEPIYFDEWQQAVALDRAMSGLVGQKAPNPEDTLYRLINQHLVLRAAETAGLPKADEAQAEAWLAGFLVSLNLEETTLEQSLTDVGLTRAELVAGLVPRLLEVQQALDTLPPDGDGNAWVADLRGQARVVLFESVAVPEPLDLPMPTAASVSPASRPLDQTTASPRSPSAGPQVGELAPDFSLKTTDGVTVRLSDLRGQPVLLNFWAPWCIPCRKELPMLEAVGSDDLAILGIAVREPPDKVITFATDLGLELPLLLDEDGQASDAYQVRGLPTSVFLNQEGVIAARHVGPLDQDALDNYLALLLVTSSSPASTP